MAKHHQQQEGLDNDVDNSESGSLSSNSQSAAESSISMWFKSGIFFEGRRSKTRPKIN